MAAKLAVIGGGNMGFAIVRGVTSALPDLLPPARAVLHLTPRDVVVCELDEGRRSLLGTLGVTVTDSAAEAVELLNPDNGHALLAVKPQSLGAVSAQLRDRLPRTCGVISILAGTPSAKIAVALGRERGIVRAMPNLAVKVKMGLTAIAHVGAQDGTQADFAESLFQSVGTTMRIDESLMDAFTALAGSGPAYLMYLAEAMMRAGEQMGFDSATADQAARATLMGAAILATDQGSTPSELRASVTSKGGTTEAAVKVLDDRAVMQAFVDAIVRARDRGRELGG